MTTQKPPPGRQPATCGAKATGLNAPDWTCAKPPGHEHLHETRDGGTWEDTTFLPPEPAPVTCRHCGQPIERCTECPREDVNLFPGWLHLQTTGDGTVLTGLHRCNDAGCNGPFAEPALRLDGSQPDPDPHHCAVCGNTIGLRIVFNQHYCEDKGACWDRRHETLDRRHAPAARPWGGVL